MDLITHISQLDESKAYTYTDYLTWQLTDRIELIMGRIFRMSPAPSSEHQQISITRQHLPVSKKEELPRLSRAL